MQKRGLGRGLGALISASEKTMQTGNQVGVLELELTQLEPNPDQPRKHFDDESMAELAESIKSYGVIQPLIVKQVDDSYYLIIAGERRWRAARLAGLTHLPVIVKDYTDEEVLHVALIENIQRKDLNPIEEAMCYRRLADEFQLTQEEISKQVGKSRNSITYALGLLNLDLRVQNYLIEGSLTPGHARSVMTIKDNDAQYELAEKIIDEGLTTRQTQALLKERQEETLPVKDTWTPRASKPSGAPRFAAVESDLRTIMGTGVNIVNGKKKGKIEIEYYSGDELERLIGMFKRLR
ncbi:MAG: ParB/RepB/Spo0J family partition protein [Defluviitaleaceae bacterium]|nr:ParB/RepB/Spo0J family partition protein [Defluviitaleaceae bacterium]